MTTDEILKEMSERIEYASDTGNTYCGMVLKCDNNKDYNRTLENMEEAETQLEEDGFDVSIIDMESQNIISIIVSWEN